MADPGPRVEDRPPVMLVQAETEAARRLRSPPPLRLVWPALSPPALAARHPLARLEEEAALRLRAAAELAGRPSAQATSGSAR